jgi:lysophospholipase L1-like esterase
MRPILRRSRRLLSWLGTGWSILGLTLLLIVLMELGLRGTFWLKDLRTPRISPDPRVMSAIEGSASWLPAHYRELEALSDRWQPYVYFRQRPFRGQTITIDEDGLRETWKRPGPEASTARKAPPVRLLMLGGSSLWGFGARDEWTIPSLVARGLHERGVDVEVRNLAEIGYVSTQELIALVRELQGGYRPDVVLFYDGVNDTTSALLERQPAVTTNEVNRVREFNLLQSPAWLAAALVVNLVRDSASFRFAGAVGRRFTGNAVRDPRVPAEGEQLSLARGVVRRYAANVGLIEALGKAYGFRPLFVWQPVIFNKPSLVPFEQEESDKFGWTRDMFRHVHNALDQTVDLNSNPDFWNLHEVFKQTQPLVFLDFCHTTEAANESIARMLVERMIPRMKARGEPVETPFR